MNAFGFKKMTTKNVRTADHVLCLLSIITTGEKYQIKTSVHKIIFQENTNQLYYHEINTVAATCIVLTK